MNIDRNHFESAVMMAEAVSQEQTVIQGFRDGELVGSCNSDHMYAGLDYFEEQGVDSIYIGGERYTRR